MGGRSGGEDSSQLLSLCGGDHLVSHQTFIGHLLCARHCAWCEDTLVNKAEKILSLFLGLTF